MAVDLRLLTTWGGQVMALARADNIIAAAEAQLVWGMGREKHAMDRAAEAPQDCSRSTD
jgi:hypothetical protein